VEKLHSTVIPIFSSKRKGLYPVAGSNLHPKVRALPFYCPNLPSVGERSSSGCYSDSLSEEDKTEEGKVLSRRKYEMVSRKTPFYSLSPRGRGLG
jgi:hypothetical protein